MNVNAAQEKNASLIEVEEDHYHEKQQWQFCAIHAVNNMLQADPNKNSQMYATKKEFNDIAKRLTAEEYELGASSWFSLSNHYTPLIGNYSFEVIEIALRRRQVGLEWYSKDVSLEECDSSTLGFILNATKVGWNWSRYLPVERKRHWFTIRLSSNGTWLLIDSYQVDIQEFASVDELKIFIELVMADDGSVMRAFHSDLAIKGKK